MPSCFWRVDIVIANKERDDALDPSLVREVRRKLISETRIVYN